MHPYYLKKSCCWFPLVCLIILNSPLSFSLPVEDSPTYLLFSVCSAPTQSVKHVNFFQVFPKWCLPTKPCLAAEIIEEQTPDQEKLKLYDTTMILSWRFLCWTHIPFFFPPIMVYSHIVGRTYQNKILPKWCLLLNPF